MKDDPGLEALNIINTATEADFRYNQLVELMPAAVYTCDAAGYITQYNGAAAAMWGREPELGKEMWCGSWKIYTPDGEPVELATCPMATAIKEGKAVRGVEIVIERPDGKRLNVLPYPSPLFDTSGNITGAINILIDITERKATEAIAAKTIAIVQSSDDAIISKTLEGIVTSWNPGAERIFGYTADEMIGQSIMKLIPPERHDEEPKILGMLRKGQRIDHYETQRMRKDGTLLDISVTVSPVRNSEGKIIGASKIARDITPQKQMERLARESEERFKMAVASTGLGTWEYNPLSGYLEWSEECKKIYGVPDGFKPDFETFSKYIYEEDAARTQQAITKAMDASGSGNYDIQFRIVRQTDNAIRWIRSQGKVYFNDKMQPTRFIGTVLDITDDKSTKEALETEVMKRTEQLNKVNEQLARSNKDLEQFAYVSSHDLQEPLRKISTFADRLQVKGENMLNDELNGYISRIVHSTGKMSVLIKDLLNYAKVGRNETQFKKVDLNDVFNSVIDDLEFIIARENATIVTQGLPVLEGIQTQMNQLFYNLINNALKFSIPGQSPQVNIFSRELEEEEIAKYKLAPGTGYYLFEFRDKGIGFNELYSERIFTIFQRLNSREDYPGTGIGLALCKKVVENHHGLIFAKGAEKKGATFSVILPVKQVAAAI